MTLHIGLARGHRFFLANLSKNALLNIKMSECQTKAGNQECFAKLAKLAKFTKLTKLAKLAKLANSCKTCNTYKFLQNF